MLTLRGLEGGCVYIVESDVEYKGERLHGAFSEHTLAEIAIKHLKHKVGDNVEFTIHKISVQ